MADFVEVARIDQIPPGSGFPFNVAGKAVAVFNVEGHALRDRRYVSSRWRFVGTGKARWQVVTCPVHGMKFDVTPDALRAHRISELTRFQRGLWTEEFWSH